MRLGITLLLAAALVLGGVFLFRGETARIGVALGLEEGCVACHGRVTGLAGDHAPERIGCASCHAGDRRTMDKAGAHAGMVLVPGNLADAARTCGQFGCHEAIVPRVERSIMATMAGVIAVNRAVLGEPAREGEAIPHAQRLGHGVADSHLRELCVGCHLGQAKADWGPIGEESQGGGCNACHLEYPPEAASELKRYAASPRKDRTASPATHPTLTLNPRNGHCFGCHSRSGRIGLSYEGWNEMHTPDGKAPAGAGTPTIRKLDDGRFVEKIVPDIHHERGLECIDCHTANEVMGAGALVARKSQQQRVGCEDCHAREPVSVAADSRDPESVRLHALRKWTLGPGQRMGTTRDGEPLVNVVVEEGKGARLLRKRTGDSLPLK
ncbi:MAG: multiheme c-type cytochrome, partial [Betaproteobacteria bacterium]|nr:multiheme c-type cytochrome [Betaproteobacteria bacterium]